jgi:hypothetical protein
MEPDISILRKTGHFYFALTHPFLLCRRNVRMSGLCKLERSSFMQLLKSCSSLSAEPF